MNKLGKLEIYKIANFLPISKLLDFCLASKSKLFYLIWTDNQYWKQRYQREYGFLSNLYVNKFLRQLYLDSLSKPNNDWRVLYQRHYQLYRFIDNNQIIHEKFVAYILDEDLQYFQSGYITKVRKLEIVQIHAWICLSYYLSDTNSIHYSKKQCFVWIEDPQTILILANDLLFWSLSQISNPKKYDNIYYPMPIQINHNTTDESRPLFMLNEGVIDSIKLTEENYQWLILFIQYYYQKIPHSLLETILLFSDSFPIIKFVLDNHHPEFNIDWITESIEMSNLKSAIQKIKLIKDKYGPQIFLKEDNQERLVKFFSYNNRHINHPIARAIWRELNLSSK